MSAGVPDDAPDIPRWSDELLRALSLFDHAVVLLDDNHGVAHWRSK